MIQQVVEMLQMCIEAEQKINNKLLSQEELMSKIETNRIENKEQLNEDFE